MPFKNPHLLFARSFLILALSGGMFGAGLTKGTLAAPQSQGSSFNDPSSAQSDSCYPHTGWVWTNGPLRPDLALQAQLALEKEGIQSIVVAREYGETDSCGTFERFSTDFTVTLKSDLAEPPSAEAQSELADSIRATLLDFGEPQLGNVRIDFGSGPVKSYSSPPDMQSAGADTSSNQSLNTEAVLNKKVFLLVYNPILSNGQDLNTYMGWPAYTTTVQGIIDSFQISSQGQLQYTIAHTQVVADEWPVKTDGFRYTEDTYFGVLRHELPPHQPDTADYNVIIDNPEFDICGKFNRGEIDELWMYGAPYFGFYESRLVGPDAYFYNSPPMTGTHNCNKLLPIMGFNYERGVAEAVHSHGHRAEATMTKVYGSWQENRTAHSWDRFALVKAQSPDYSYSGCGSVHYPPNGLSDYDYSNTGSTLTNCEDFANYPNLSDPLEVAQLVTCTTWNCDHLHYMEYWFGHLPFNPGCGPDAVESNWWSYFVDPSLALFPGLNCPPLSPGPLWPGDTVRVSVNSGGGQALAESIYPAISSDGRFVAFRSQATNLVPGDTNSTGDIFVRNLQTGLTQRVSVDSSGVQANNQSYFSSLSGDGRYVAFESYATNLVPGDTNGGLDVFLHDLQTGTTTLVSVDASGEPGGYYSEHPSISDDGRYVAFSSYATNLITGDTNGTKDVFVRDLQLGLTTVASVTSSGIQGNALSDFPSISTNGRFVAFISSATNLVAGDTNGWSDVFVHDLQSGVTTRVSVDSNGVQANMPPGNMSISGDGRYIAFESTATNLVPGDTNGTYDVFLHDRQTGITTRLSVNASGIQGDRSSGDPSISSDGRFIAFRSDATNLVPGKTTATPSILVRDMQTGTITLASVDSNGVQANYQSFYPAISADGQLITFASYATNLVLGDTNEVQDVFVHRLDTVVPPTVTPTFTPTSTSTNTPTRTPTSTPTKTPTPTNTSTPTPTPDLSSSAFYLSLTGSQTIGGIASADEDILRFDGQTWSLFFDGSDVGVASPDLFAFSIVDADTILMSFSNAVTVNGISVAPQDVLQFNATSLGSNTTGSFSLYFDGSDVGFDTSAEKIDSLSLLPDGRLLLSTTGNPSVSGLTSGRDEDVLVFTPNSLGNTTSGTWAMYFDGSDVGLADTSGEDVDALDVVGTNIYLSTADNFSVNGVAGADEDIFVCSNATPGDVTTCNYSSSLYFDGSTWGLAANDVDAFNFLAAGPIPPTTPTNTSTPTNTPLATNTPTSTPTATPSVITPTFTPTVTPSSGNSTGWLSPTTQSAVSSGDGNGFESNPTYAFTHDELFAIDVDSGTTTSTSCTDSGKDRHRFLNYNISLPAGATVQGIHVILDAKADSVVGSPKVCVSLSWDGGSSWTAWKSTTALTTSEASYILGGPSDLWGHTWLSTELANTSFRVRLANVASDTTRDFYLDWVSVKVAYAP